MNDPNETLPNVFYEARLTNASVSMLNTSSVASNYFLNGTWNVYTVTSNDKVITNTSGQIISIHRSSTNSLKSNGEFNVTDNGIN